MGQLLANLRSVAEYNIIFNMVVGFVRHLRLLRLSALLRGLKFTSSTIWSKSRTLLFAGIIFSAKVSSIFS
jgi:hypothetical protein